MFHWRMAQWLESICLVVGRPGLDSLAKSDQKTSKRDSVWVWR